MKTITKLYMQLDVNGDGTISREDFHHYDERFVSLGLWTRSPSPFLLTLACQHAERHHACKVERAEAHV